QRSIEDQTQAGDVYGTPAYMPPEQAQGEVAKIDCRADVFSLGGILCEILTGKPPYAGKFAEVRAKSIAGQLDDAYARLDGCGADAELIGLAKDCLAADPAARPADAAAVATAVAAYQTGVADRLQRATVE